MKPRTKEQDGRAFRRMKKVADEKGWSNVYLWAFKSPSNTIHDLSAANPEKLDYIEANRVFLMERGA